MVAPRKRWTRLLSVSACAVVLIGVIGSPTDASNAPTRSFLFSPTPSSGPESRSAQCRVVYSKRIVYRHHVWGRHIRAKRHPLCSCRCNWLLGDSCVLSDQLLLCGSWWQQQRHDPSTSRYLGLSPQLRVFQQRCALGVRVLSISEFLYGGRWNHPGPKLRCRGHRDVGRSPLVRGQGCRSISRHRHPYIYQLDVVHQPNVLRGR